MFQCRIKNMHNKEHYEREGRAQIDRIQEDDR